jgi:hypothetical protein
VTLRGIRQLVRHCPRLKALKISFDASVVPDGILSTEEKSGLAWFDVDDAVLVDPASVAAYLFALFPGLKALMWSRRHEMAEDVRERVDQLDALWGEVEELHPTVWAATTADICF